ncbi:MAG: alpha/beta hydrolase [Verrucomicrobiales bacterium]|nr:alpha/beta hydrolase [Verrucomicrobiales bacterium]
MSDVILIHGAWCHPDIAAPLRFHLEDLGYQVHSPALPGHDLSNPWPPEKVAQLSLEDYAESIRVYLAEQNFDSPPILVGHSMGGLVAQMVAAKSPVSALVLLNSAGPAGINHIYPSSVRATLDILLQPFFWKRSGRPSHRRAHYGLLNRVPFKSAEKISRSLIPESGRVFFEMVFWFLDPSGTTRIERDIDAPILIVSGGMDRIVLPRVAKGLHRRYPLASFLSFPASGHWLFHEHGSERAFSAISDWMETIPERRSFIEGQKDAHHDPGITPSSSPDIPAELHPRDDSPLDHPRPLRGNPDGNTKPGGRPLLP